MDPEKLRENIANGKVTRNQLYKLRNRYASLLSDPSKSQLASDLLDVVEATEIPPSMAEYLFLGHCPGARVENSLLDQWVNDSYCDFRHIEDEKQLQKFFEIYPGDILILKKRDIAKQEMEISAWGKVTSVHTSRTTGIPYLRVNWTKPDHFLVVPLMGCTRTVNVRSLEKVENTMPPEFWEWLTPKTH